MKNTLLINSLFEEVKHLYCLEKNIKLEINFKVLFIIFYDNYVKDIISNFDKSKILIIAPIKLGFFLKNKYSQIRIISIDIRKLKSFDTKVYEGELFKSITSFVKGNIEICFLKEKYLCNLIEKEEVNAEVNKDNLNIFPIIAYLFMNKLLSGIYIGEYVNSKSAIKNLEYMALNTKSLLRKAKSKKDVESCTINMIKI